MKGNLFVVVVFSFLTHDSVEIFLLYVFTKKKKNFVVASFSFLKSKKKKKYFLQALVFTKSFSQKKTLVKLIFFVMFSHYVRVSNHAAIAVVIAVLLLFSHFCFRQSRHRTTTNVKFGNAQRTLPPSTTDGGSPTGDPQQQQRHRPARLLLSRPRCPQSNETINGVPIGNLLSFPNETKIRSCVGVPFSQIRPCVGMRGVSTVDAKWESRLVANIDPVFAPMHGGVTAKRLVQTMKRLASTARCP